MKIGIPREVKEGERRVALTPTEVAVLARDGHEVRLESGAGMTVGHHDDDYRAVRALVVPGEQAWRAELIVKVKEIQRGEEARAAPGQTLFGFQHLVGEPTTARELAARGITAIAFEMVRDAQGQFPLLVPMSAIAGRMAVRVGARAGAALPFVRDLAGKGIARAVRESSALRAGVLLWKGHVNHRGIAEESGLPYTPLSDADLA